MQGKQDRMLQCVSQVTSILNREGEWEVEQHERIITFIWAVASRHVAPFGFRCATSGPICASI